MSPRDWQTRIQDMLTCGYNINEFTSGLSYDAFLDDPRTIRAVAFELTTLGEAVRALPIEIKDSYPEIPWGKIQGTRNVLIHEYYRLDEEIIWQTIQKDIPSLIEMLEKIIKDN